MTPFESVSAALGAHRIVPVVSVPTAEAAVPLAEALLAGGLPIAEITFRTDAAAAAIAAIRSSHPDVLVGAGTVLTVATAQLAVDAGAQFAVTPGFNPLVVDFFLERGIPIVPGASTPTEIDMCINRGVWLVKFFPSEASGGIAYLKAISAPYAGISFMPTGGVTLANIADYLALPAVLACGGTWLAPTDLIANGDFDSIAANVRAAVDLISTL